MQYFSQTNQNNVWSSDDSTSKVKDFSKKSNGSTIIFRVEKSMKNVIPGQNLEEISKEDEERFYKKVFKTDFL
jgi:hypothetical protein